MKAKNREASFEDEIEDIKEALKNISDAKTLDSVKEAAALVSEKIPLLVSLGKDKVIEAKDKTKEAIQDSPFVSMAASFAIGAVIVALFKK